MAFYVTQGSVPGKRHVVHKRGGEHTYEELVEQHHLQSKEEAQEKDQP